MEPWKGGNEWSNGTVDKKKKGLFFESRVGQTLFLSIFWEISKICRNNTYSVGDRLRMDFSFRSLYANIYFLTIHSS